MSHENIVQKVWGLCHILRGDGISYHQYVSELTYLLFLKIAEENTTEKLLPVGYRWSDLVAYNGGNLLGFYQEMLTHLGANANNETVKAIYSFPTTVFSHSQNLKAVIQGISKIDWHDVESDRIGDVYEGLGEIIQDPASGSGGFLVAADHFIRCTETSESYDKTPPKYQGAEIEKNTRRICLMNTFLNSLDAEIIYGDALTDDVKNFYPPDLILANPPFGNKAGSRRIVRSEISYPNANKQLVFLQHIYLSLKENGRAAVVVPDNVLFDGGIGKSVREDLMNRCNLHTILRLPSGIFSSATVKTNVLFFYKNKNHKTGDVWFYDLRSNMPKFGKTTPLADSHFHDFETWFGQDPFGSFERGKSDKSSRSKLYTRQSIEEDDYNLDLKWLEDEGKEHPDLQLSPEEIALSIFGRLTRALEEVSAIVDELDTPNRNEELIDD